MKQSVLSIIKVSREKQLSLCFRRTESLVTQLQQK